MKIRIMCTKEEEAGALCGIASAFDVLEVSEFYPNKGNSKLGRIYIEATPAEHVRPKAKYKLLRIYTECITEKDEYYRDEYTYQKDVGAEFVVGENEQVLEFDDLHDAEIACNMAISNERTHPQFDEEFRSYEVVAEDSIHYFTDLFDNPEEAYQG